MAPTVYGSFVFALVTQMTSALTEADIKKILDKHNLYRCMHGLPLFTWDTTAATSAQAWANNGVWDHSGRDSRNGCGENLAWGHTQGDEAVQAWYEEIKYTSPYGTATSFTDSSPAGKAIGHYTAMMWAASTTIGCGLGRASVGGSEGDFWVCHYCPGGNIGGQFEDNVVAPIRSAESCGGSAEDVPANFPTLPDEAPPVAPAPAPAAEATEPPAAVGTEPPAEAEPQPAPETAAPELPQKDPEEAEEEATRPVDTQGTQVSGELELEGKAEEVCENEKILLQIKYLIFSWLGSPAWLKPVEDNIAIDCAVLGRRLQLGDENTMTIHYYISVPPPGSVLDVAKVMSNHFFVDMNLLEGVQMDDHHHQHHHVVHGSMPENDEEALQEGLDSILEKFTPGQSTPTRRVVSWFGLGVLSSVVVASAFIGLAYRRRRNSEPTLLETVDE